MVDYSIHAYNAMLSALMFGAMSLSCTLTRCLDSASREACKAAAAVDAHLSHKTNESPIGT